MNDSVDPKPGVKLIKVEAHAAPGVRSPAVKKSTGGHNHHGHHHGHHHVGSGEGAMKSLRVVLFLNLGFSIIEFIGGYLTNSTAVVADAAHDFGDSMAIAMALIMEKVAQGKSNSKFSYGYRRWSLLSAVFTGAFLLVSSALVLSFAIPRLFNPVQPKVEGVIGLAILGIAVNSYAAWRLLKGATKNERMISWHMIEDVLGWVVILISAIVMMFVDLPILDPILSIIYVLIIIFGVGRNMIGTVNLFLQGVPEDVDLEAIKTKVLALPGVRGLHDLHIWSLDGASHVLTGHVVVDGAATVSDADKIKVKVRSILSENTSIHATLEVEAEDSDCKDIDCGS